MVQIRGNRRKHLISHAVAMVLLCTGLPAGVTRTYGLGIFVGWPKEAAP